MESINNIPATIDEYISAFPDETRNILQEIRAIIKAEAPGAKELINYGMPTFQLHGNLVHFAAYKKHIGFYPTPSGIEAFKEELSPYVNAKGSVQFPLEQPIPFDLIRRITAFRVKETMEKGYSKRNRK
ncbi:MAG: iron chaperone [Anaerolineaceae bacterium]